MVFFWFKIWCVMGFICAGLGFWRYTKCVERYTGRAYKMRNWKVHDPDMPLDWLFMLPMYIAALYVIVCYICALGPFSLFYFGNFDENRYNGYY